MNVQENKPELILVENFLEELKAKVGTSRDCDEIVMGTNDTRCH